MSKVDDYLKQQLQKSSKQGMDKEIFLGHSPSDITYFITIPELLRAPEQLCNSLREQIAENKLKVVINGNIYDDALVKILKVVLDNKADYSVIVRDGFKAYKESLFFSDQVGLLLVKPASEAPLVNS
jgi:hypothetical protein